MFTKLFGMIREHIIKRITRSSHWPTVRKHFLKSNPTCAACGSNKHLNVHHVMPFHDDPAKELDLNNLITLCMDEHECHLKLGHGDDFKAYNPDIRTIAESVLKDPTSRTLAEQTCKLNKKY